MPSPVSSVSYASGAGLSALARRKRSAPDPFGATEDQSVAAEGAIAGRPCLAPTNRAPGAR